MKTVVVVVRSADAARVAEALRGAVGLTLRGDRVEVVLCPGAAAPDPRAVATLSSFGHPVHSDLGALTRADAIEVWS